MKRIFFATLVLFLTAPFAVCDDLTVKISPDNEIEILNMPFRNNRIGNCSVIYSDKKPYTRILYCRICQQGQDPFRDGKSEHLYFTAKQWAVVDNYIYKSLGKYSLWHNDPSPIVKNAGELAKIEKDRRIMLANAIAECKKSGGFYNVKTGGCYINMTSGMTKQEKEDYFRAKDFEEEYKNYLKYRGL